MADNFDQYNPGLNAASGETTAQKQKPISPENPFKLGIVGHGFVGKAVEYAFTHPLVDLHIVDPKYDNNIDSMVEFNPMCINIELNNIESPMRQICQNKNFVKTKLL